MARQVVKVGVMVGPKNTWIKLNLHLYKHTYMYMHTSHTVLAKQESSGHILSRGYQFVISAWL